ncbi:MAG: SCP2 sterol-binding domain-containing protein [gamma proteobacterium symbiont of Taylorina sp.]|nr:SCP2 sterol-binding domain-containing protein [gamma proteobacterium symbiont of Taylorina sp.]
MKKVFPMPPSPTVVAQKVAQKMSSDIPRIIKHLPKPPFILQKKLGEKILGKLMAEQIEMGDFDCLADKWVNIVVNDMGLSFFLTFRDEQLQLSNQITQADVIFSGNSKEFILLASRSEDPDTLFFQRRLLIEGDTELALAIKNSIDGIDFDNWPAWLNQIIQKVASFVTQEESETSRTFSQHEFGHHHL